VNLNQLVLGIKTIEAYRGRECIPDMVEAKYRAKFIQGIEEIASDKCDSVTVSFFIKILQMDILNIS
jgi:homoserine kinase